MAGRRRRLVIWLGLPLAVYLGIVVLLTLLQDRLVFPMAGAGDRGVGSPALPVAVDAIVRADGGRQRIAIVSGGGDRPRAVALYFVGNGEDLLSAAAGAEVLARYGLEVLGVEHPGYGASDGPVGVATSLAGAEAAAARARTRADELAVPLVAVGSSLGTFCAVHLAALGRVDRLLLRAPPTSMAAAAGARFPWLPIGLLLRHRFDNLGVADRVRCPVLILHGDRDDVVPLAQGQELCAAFGGPAKLIVATGCRHNDLPLDRDGPYGARIAAFLSGA